MGRAEPAVDHIMTAGMLITFMLLGKILESRAKVQTAFAIKHLLKCQPKTALLVCGDVSEGMGGEDDVVEREVAVELLHKGDVVKVNSPIPGTRYIHTSLELYLHMLHCYAYICR